MLQENKAEHETQDECVDNIFELQVSTKYDVDRVNRGDDRRRDAKHCQCRAEIALTPIFHLPHGYNAMIHWRALVVHRRTGVATPRYGALALSNS
jgi:hypothetical protein